MEDNNSPIQQSNQFHTFIQWGAFFLLGVSLVFGGRITQLHIDSQAPFTTTQSAFTLFPPTKSLQGKITASSGIVEKRGREDEDFQPLKDTTIVQGDSLATKQGSAEILLGVLTNLKLLNNSEIGFVNLLPNSFLFRQSSGTVIYKLQSPFAGRPHFSLRVLHSLIETETVGTVTVSIVQPFVTIISDMEEVKIALVDLENKTHVYTVKPEETARINDEIRGVEIH